MGTSGSTGCSPMRAVPAPPSSRGAVQGWEGRRSVRSCAAREQDSRPTDCPSARRCICSCRSGRTVGIWTPSRRREREWTSSVSAGRCRRSITSHSLHVKHQHRLRFPAHFCPVAPARETNAERRPSAEGSPCHERRQETCNDQGVSTQDLAARHQPADLAASAGDQRHDLGTSELPHERWALAHFRWLTLMQRATPVAATDRSWLDHTCSV